MGMGSGMGMQGDMAMQGMQGSYQQGSMNGMQGQQMMGQGGFQGGMSGGMQGGMGMQGDMVGMQGGMGMEMGMQGGIGGGMGQAGWNNMGTMHNANGVGDENASTFNSQQEVNRRPAQPANLGPAAGVELATAQFGIH